MEYLTYPGFSPEQIEYLSQMFPLPNPIPGLSTMDDIMYASGRHSVLTHILAQENSKGE